MFALNLPDLLRESLVQLVFLLSETELLALLLTERGVGGVLLASGYSCFLTLDLPLLLDLELYGGDVMS